MITHPGRVWQQDFEYQTRWTWGQDGSLKIYSYPAAEDIPPGVLVQLTSGGLLQIARDTTRLAGISVYDPSHFHQDVVYNKYDMVPVMRRGSVFVSFVTLQAPFANPSPLATANFYLGAGQGQATTDAAGTPLARTVFSIASKDYYANGDGSPAKDLPFPSPMPPLGVTSTTFGSGVALVEINL